MKIGLHYSFQVGPHESGQAVVERGLRDIAEADAKGFSSVVFAEHHFLDDGLAGLMRADLEAVVQSDLHGFAGSSGVGVRNRPAGRPGTSSPSRATGRPRR